MTLGANTSTIILNAVVANTINAIDELQVSNAEGEVLRKTPQQVNVISSTKKEFVFYLNETEAVTTVTRLSLRDNTGQDNELVFAGVYIPKTGSQSLTIRWMVEVL